TRVQQLETTVETQVTRLTTATAHIKLIKPNFIQALVLQEAQVQDWYEDLGHFPKAPQPQRCRDLNGLRKCKPSPAHSSGSPSGQTSRHVDWT
ncbi:Hypothetical predicted protein, partial [Pelobates cultripes]